MRLRDLLPPQHIVVPMQAATLREALGTLVRQVHRSDHVVDPEALDRWVREGEFRDVVTAGDRVVLPHARTDAVDALVVALGVTTAPVATEAAAVEGAPRIIVLILAPTEAATLYLQLVSTLARLFRDDAVVDGLLRAQSVGDVLEVAGLKEVRVQPRLSVSDIMSRDVSRIAPERTLREAVDLMLGQGISAVPVVGDKGEVLGMVTERDIMRVLLPKVPRAGADAEVDDGSAPRQVKVRDVMGRSVLCISEDLGLTEVANIMINKDVEQLPVVTGGKLVGFITRGDIIRKLFGHEHNGTYTHDH